MGLLGKISKPCSTQPARDRGRAILEAAMAVGALVACGRGTAVLAKRKAIAEALSGNAELRGFDVSQAIDLFNLYAVRIRNDPIQGRAQALEAAAVLAGDADQARFVLEAGDAIGAGEGSGGGADTPDVAEIAALLGLAAPRACDGIFLGGRDGQRRPLVITVGNEKGGSGKSTIAMHLVVALLKLGYSVGSIDLDGRQATLSRYLTNRRTFGQTTGRSLEMPLHRRIENSRALERQTAMAEDSERLHKSLAELADRQLVVIDTPGSDSHLSRLAHANSDTVITPLNDTYLDIDVLARIDRQKHEVLGPSIYCEMVLEQNDRRAACGCHPIEWIVMRNRVTHVDSHSKRDIIGLLEQLGARLDFRLVAGFGERVVFHELFLSGLTLLDLPDDRKSDRNHQSHARAGREFRELLLEIGARV